MNCIVYADSCCSFQQWDRVDGDSMLKSHAFDLCLDSSEVQERGLIANTCNKQSPTQRWAFSLNKV